MTDDEIKKAPERMREILSQIVALSAHGKGYVGTYTTTRLNIQSTDAGGIETSLAEAMIELVNIRVPAILSAYDAVVAERDAARKELMDYVRVSGPKFDAALSELARVKAERDRLINGTDIESDHLTAKDEQHLAVVSELDEMRTLAKRLAAFVPSGFGDLLNDCQKLRVL